MSIKVITSRDMETLSTLSKVGYLSESHLKDNLNQRHSRIQGLVKSGFIERERYFSNGRSQTNVYSLTDKGKDAVVKKGPSSSSSFYKKTSPKHDLKLADRYLSLSQEERDTWLTESELRDKFDLHGKDFSVPDGAYVLDGDIISVEIVTSNYKNENIKAKFDTSAKFASDCEIIKT